ncbi:hypothetical protein B0H63DRAFT_528986 [Podospora didyma]|uniref:Heterokaryon incompatibility domain-containing protein n=1 Tax=Podospora didyma TaxID=330526 RepID=A0AAE0N410_9PEZI|nr:hypothetical protein B0H63DRAFT_528986 [Podospora didyma]
MADSLYAYAPIDLATNGIRILRLCQGEPADPIICEPVEIFLDYKMVQDNLYSALRCLRTAGEDRWLWVDALWINQDDPREKTHQVGRMAKIYEKAE